MNFYVKQHQFYAGIDLHARLLAVCILDHAGQSAQDLRTLRTVPSSCWPNLRHARDERVQGSCDQYAITGLRARDASMRRCSRPRRL